jgi:hypothetical protein
MFPVLLDRVDDANKFLDTIEKEMILANEAKNNKIRRQYEDWNTNVHGKIQVRSSCLQYIFHHISTPSEKNSNSNRFN